MSHLAYCNHQRDSTALTGENDMAMAYQGLRCPSQQRQSALPETQDGHSLVTRNRV